MFVVFSEFVYHDVVFPQRSVLEKLNIKGFKYIKVAYASSLAATVIFPAPFCFVPDGEYVVTSRSFSSTFLLITNLAFLS